MITHLIFLCIFLSIIGLLIQFFINSESKGGAGNYGQGITICIFFALIALVLFISQHLRIWWQ